LFELLIKYLSVGKHLADEPVRRSGYT